MATAANKKKVKDAHPDKWKDDYDVVPTSNIQHIQVDNMAFALNLRRSNAAPPLNSPGKDRVALLEKAKQMRDKATTKDKEESLPASSVTQLVKDNGCKSSLCKQAVLDIFTIIEDNQNLRLRFQDIAEGLKDDTEILAQLSQEYDKINAAQQVLLKSLSKLDVEIDALQRKAQTQKEEQREIEMQIMDANETIRELKNKKLSKEEEKNIKDLKSRLHDGEETNVKKKKKKQRPAKIHTGNYCLFEGKLHWSCCLAEEEDAIGCIENENVDSMTVLAQIKNVFCNQSKVVPLQTRSYRDSTQHHIIRYPMNSTDNLNFSFDEYESDYNLPPNRSALQSSFGKYSGNNHNNSGNNNGNKHTVSIDLPPKPSKRPQSAAATTTFAPFNSFFTSASAMSVDPSMSPNNYHHSSTPKKRPQTASASSLRSTNNNNTKGHVSIQEAMNNTYEGQRSSQQRPQSASFHTQHRPSLYEPSHHSQMNTTSQSQMFKKSVYNHTTVLDTRPDVLPENTILRSFRDNKVGKVRAIANDASSKLERKNRPMSSPAGYALYRDRVVQHHHPELVPQSLNASMSILQVAGYEGDSNLRYWSSEIHGNEDNSYQIPKQNNRR